MRANGMWRLGTGHLGTGVLRALAASVLLAAAASAQAIWYVNAAAPAGGNGLAWTSAFDNIDDALLAATSTDQIWVAAGTYKPQTETIPGDPRSASFVMERRHLFGGFAGWEPTLAQRVGLYRITILSGDLGLPGNPSDNAYHVVTAHRTVELDGFTIRDGNARGAIVSSGAGLYGETVTIPGGGQGPAIFLSRCSFLENRVSGRGGALYAQLAYVLLERCNFSGNSADKGGALCTNVTTIDAYNCEFIGNTAQSRGGAIFFFSDSGTPPTNRFSNCVFALNQANEGGAAYLLGAMYTAGSATWANCTFTRNTALTQGGAILAHDGPTGLGDPVNQIQNCIVWGNQAPLDPNLSGLAQPVFSIIEGWTAGPSSVYTVDPLFVDAAHGNYRLQAASPAIDAGNGLYLRPDLADLDQNGITYEPVPLDLDGRPRFVDDPGHPFGIAPYLDLGAYEY